MPMTVFHGAQPLRGLPSAKEGAAFTLWSARYADANAITYAKFCSRSHDAVIPAYDAAAM